VLLWTDSPDHNLIRWVRSRGGLILLIDRAFEDVALEFMDARGAALSDCARVLALSRSGWWQLAQLPGSTIVDNLEDIGPAIAGWLEQSPPNGAASPLPVPLLDAAQASTDPPAQWNAAVMAGLAAFYGKKAGFEARELAIGLPLLFDGTPPHPPLSGTIDLTGPVRALSFGPFLYLPQGDWALQFSFEASLNRTGNTLMFDIFVDDKAKCETEFALIEDGRFTFECEFAVRDPWSTFEFRSHLRRGAIEGRFTPLSLHLRRL
jgi:hypothetical protein